jgi:ABC-2 type transport system ATP-binding protein
MSVTLENVTIRYGAHTAVENLSVTFEQGAVGLLGRNGAGKSSVLKALLGLVRPVSGRMRFSDLPEGAAATEVRAHVGYMPERDAHLPQATGFEMVSLLGMLSGMPRSDAWRRTHEVLYLVGLDEQRYRPVSGYSAGMRQKVKLAQALVHDPRVLFLDEPTNGLDPGGRVEMLRLVRQLSKDLGKSVVFSTHILQDVEAVCDAAIVMEKGLVVAKGSLQELTGSASREHKIVVEPKELDLAGCLREVALVRADGEGRHAVTLRESATLGDLFGAVLRGGGVVRSLVPHRRTLEEVFLSAVATEPSLPETR